MRATFTERATGALGDARETLVALAARLGTRTSANLTRSWHLRHEQQRQVLTARAGLSRLLPPSAMRAKRGHLDGLHE